MGSNPKMSCGFWSIFGVPPDYLISRQARANLNHYFISLNNLKAWIWFRSKSCQPQPKFDFFMTSGPAFRRWGTGPHPSPPIHLQLQARTCRRLPQSAFLGGTAKKPGLFKCFLFGLGWDRPQYIFTGWGGVVQDAGGRFGTALC